MKSKIVCVDEPNKVSIKEYDLKVGPNQILVKSHMASICGTDKNYFMGKMPKETLVKDPSHSDSEVHATYPLAMGHEGAGEVIEVGPGVTEFKPGDKVMSFGWYNTMAEYWVGPIRHDGYGVIKVPDGMSMDAASLGEPAACAIYAGMQSGVELGDTVAIIGAGFAGQVISQVVKAMGAYKVICVDVVDKKLELAKELGADMIINAKKEDAVQIILDETRGYGVDVAIEAAGLSQTIELSTSILKHGGIIGLYSWVLDPINLYINRWHNDGFDIRTLALMHRIKHDRPWWINKTLQTIAQGQVKIEPLISHVYALANAGEAFKTACFDETACKVMLRS
jgi:L-iditol 2-dehydrogenase